jgi:hypothetical protein
VKKILKVCGVCVDGVGGWLVDLILVGRRVVVVVMCWGGRGLIFFALDRLLLDSKSPSCICHTSTGVQEEFFVQRRHHQGRRARGGDPALGCVSLCLSLLLD